MAKIVSKIGFVITFYIGICFVAVLYIQTSWVNCSSSFFCIKPAAIRKLEQISETTKKKTEVVQLRGDAMTKSVPVNTRQMNDAGNVDLLGNVKTHEIVMFNPVNWLSIEHYNKVLSSDCSYKNCILTKQTGDLRHQSAILFTIMSAPGLPRKPPLLPYERRPDQAWVFAWAEPPAIHGNAVYRNAYWNGTVNWTMAYTLDSDIVLPFGKLNSQASPVKNYSQIFQRKTKMAAWVVSNCNTPSKRDKYVAQLRRHGVDVDIYGRCTRNRVDRGTIRKEIDLKYKFYLSFENSICKDYITEKFFSYFQQDVILVVRGGGDYDKLLPNNAFINTATFLSIKDMAQYMLSVASSEEQYTNYLRNKDKFESNTDVVNARNQSFCTLCEKLNNLDKHRKIYTDVNFYIHNGTCAKPKDIQTK